MRALAIIAASAAAVTVAGATAARPTSPAQTICGGDIKAIVIGGVVHYCGPAVAHVSRFPRVRFRGGSCTWSVRAGFRLLDVYIGSVTVNVKTNSGRAFFSLRVYGSPPRPRGADVEIFARGKRWSGTTRSLRITETSGRFVAQPLNGSKGWASGTYTCY
jgi:hypothetical protein